MLRIAMIDDEKDFLVVMKNMTDKLFLEQNYEFQSFIFTESEELLIKHHQNEFQLVFLDIDMPEINGFDIASEIRKDNSEAVIIFVSGHSNYVFETFRYAPFRFIRKEKLETELPEAIRSFCIELNKTQRYIKLELNNKTSISEDIGNIVYFFSIRHNIFFITKTMQTQMLSPRIYTMEKIEEMLGEYGFLRIHKSYLVNYHFVYQFAENNVILTTKQNNQNEVLPVSHRRISDMKKQYQILVREGDDV